MRKAQKEGIEMELLIALAFVVTVDILAIWFGKDSREGVDRRPESLGIIH